MLLESVSSTAKRAEELLNSINENKIETPFHHVEEYFTGWYSRPGFELVGIGLLVFMVSLHFHQL